MRGRVSGEVQKFLCVQQNVANIGPKTMVAGLSVMWNLIRISLFLHECDKGLNLVGLRLSSECFKKQSLSPLIQRYPFGVAKAPLCPHPRLLVHESIVQKQEGLSRHVA